MRALTTPATLITGRTYTAPILLVTITTTSGMVFKFSDYDRVIEGAEYLGLIQNPQDLTEALNDFDGGGSPATAHLVLFNDRPVGTKARFSDLIQTPRNTSGTYDFRNARVDIDRMESGQLIADAVRLQSFYLEAPSDIGDSLITLQMSDLSQKIEDSLPITKVTRTLFPTASPSAIDTSIRRLFGTLKNVKATPIVDGALTTLTSDITAVATSVALDDASLFPNSGTALIETEFMSWTGKSGNTLLNVVRATQSSTAVAHSAGTDVMHARTDEYVYAVGEAIYLPTTDGPELILNGTFATNVTSWTGSGTWDSANGGQAKLAIAGLQNLLQERAVEANATYRLRFTIRTSTIRTFVSDATGGSGNVLYDVENVPGDYLLTLSSTTSLMYINFINGNDADSFLDTVSLKKVGRLYPLKSITNVKVNGHAARTSPTTTLSDATRLTNRIFGTIRFVPSSVSAFHTLPLAGSIPAAPNQIKTETIDWVGNQTASKTLTLTPPTSGAEYFVGTVRRRATITWRVISGTFVVSGTNSVTRTDPASGSVITIYSDVTGPGIDFPATLTIEYDTGQSLAAETFTLNFSGDADAYNYEWQVIDYFITTPIQSGGGGNSTAGRVIGEVTCDVEGITDDPEGTLSGTANLLLENPTDITAAIMRLLYGVATTDLDGTWTTTRTIMQSAGYTWAVLLESMQFSQLRRILSDQARARLILSSGKVGLRFRSYRPTADLTLQYDPTGGRTGLAQDLTVKLTSPTESIGGLTARYAYNDQLGEFQKSVTVGDGTAAAALPTMDLSFVATDTMAQDIAAYWYGLKRRQRFSVDGTAWHNVLALEQGDHFAVKGHPALVQHGDQALIFAILRKTDRGGREGIGQIRLGGLEDTIEGDVGPEDTSMAWGSRGLLARNNAATPNTKFDVTANAVILRNSANLIVVRHNPGSITVDLGLSGPIANGRDQSLPHTASTFIHIYWVWDPTNAILALTSSQTAPPTGPAFPNSNFTYWGYVGAVYFSAGSALVRTTIAGSWASRTTVEALAAAVTDNTEHSIDGSAIWPLNAMKISGTWGAILNVAGDSADLRAESGVDAGPHLETPGATTTGFGGGFTMNVTGQTIWYIQSANASRVWRVEINGYELPNGG